MAKKTKQDNIDLNFEQTIKELTDIVCKIEAGQIPLQESIEQYERGMKLIKHSRNILKEAEKKIEKISETDEEIDKKSGDELFD